MLSTLSRPEIAGFSHSDYPKMQPFLAALYAFPFPEWKEQIAKSCMALLWVPVFSEIFQMKNLKVKLLSFLLILVLSGGQIIAGMTDWLLACYVLISFLIYHENEDRWMDSIIYLSLPFLIKAEGLVITGLGVSIILVLKSEFSFKIFFKNLRDIAPFFMIPGLAFLLWKVHCRHHEIHNYLTADIGSALHRIIERLSDGGKSFTVFVNGFGYYNKVIKNMFYVALIRRLFVWRKVTSFEVAVFSFCAVYFCFLFFTYMATPFDLDWHLTTSVERTAFPIFLLSLVTLLIRDIGAAESV